MRTHLTLYFKTISSAQGYLAQASTSKDYHPNYEGKNDSKLSLSGRWAFSLAQSEVGFSGKCVG